MFKNYKGGKGNIHAKIYCIDNKYVYLGSLNLSNSGMKNNLETSILIKDKEFVKQISSKIDDLYNDCGRGNYSDTDIINIFSKLNK